MAPTDKTSEMTRFLRACTIGSKLRHHGVFGRRPFGAVGLETTELELYLARLEAGEPELAAEVRRRLVSTQQSRLVLEDLGEPAALVDDPFWRRSVAANLQYRAALAADVEMARMSIALLERLRTEKPDDRRALRWLGAGHQLLGNLLAQAGERDAARAAWERAVAALAPSRTVSKPATPAAGR
jgi:hypothetical protein